MSEWFFGRGDEVLAGGDDGVRLSAFVYFIFILFGGGMYSASCGFP